MSGLRVTFINMPLRESAAPNTPPEGPGILAAILREKGHDVSILDLNAYRFPTESGNNRHLTLAETDNLIREHLNQKGDQHLVAMSGMITTLKWQTEVAKIVRWHQDDTFLISGGGLATEIAEGLFKWIPELNAIARSEGDDIICEIARDVEAGKTKKIYEGDRPKDLDAIPYAAWDLLESDPYGHNILEDYINIPVWGLEANNSSATPFSMKRSLTTVSSRGCPYACAFCYRGAQGERNYGMRSCEHLATQIKQYVDRYNLDFIGFPDDNFAVDKRRIKEMPGVFKEYGIDHVRWGTHTRMDEADERAFMMAEAGCIYIGFGAESASEKTLISMNKGGHILSRGITEKKVNGKTYRFPSSMVDAVENCRKAGIHGNCTWIMGYPGETLEDLKISVAFILWQSEGAPEDSVNQKMFTATAYPGTAMFKDKKARQLMSKNFGISFDPDGTPVYDDNLHRYVLELDDATKVLYNTDGEPLNFGAMPTRTFLKVREYVDNNELEKVLEI